MVDRTILPARFEHLGALKTCHLPGSVVSHGLYDAIERFEVAGSAYPLAKYAAIRARSDGRGAGSGSF